VKTGSRSDRARACGIAALLAAILAGAAAGGAAAQIAAGWKRGGGHPVSPGVADENAPQLVRLAEKNAFYSNLGLLDAVTRDAVTAIVDSLALPPGSTVGVSAGTNHEANWFVGNILAETLAERGYKVLVQQWAAPEPAKAAGAAAGAGGNRIGRGKRFQSLENQVPPADDAGAAAAAAAGAAAATLLGGGAATGDSLAARSDSARATADSLARQAAQPGAPGSTGGAPPGEGTLSSLLAGANPAQTGGGTSVGESTESTAEAATLATPAELAGAAQIVDLRVVEFGVKYSDIGRRLLLGPVRFTRVAGVYLQVSQYAGPQRELRRILSGERHRVDRLSGSQRALAEGASYPFAIPELKTPGLGRYIEPTVVVGIVGSLVYLFYANQSAK
jgi:hypothetical protein